MFNLRARSLVVIIYSILILLTTLLTQRNFIRVEDQLLMPNLVVKKLVVPAKSYLILRNFDGTAAKISPYGPYEPGIYHEEVLNLEDTSMFASGQRLYLYLHKDEGDVFDGTTASPLKDILGKPIRSSFKLL